MDSLEGVARSRQSRRSSRGGALLVLAFAAFVAPGIAACGGGTADPGRTMTPAHTDMAPGTGADAPMTTAWANRPGFVRANARTQEAYKFAMANAAVLRWMPCYCGCGAMGHGSNLDCFFKPTMDGLTSLTFEEHASYCEICIDTALMAKRMAGEGQSLRAIRAAIDATFGGSAPGTPTELPPA